ncbi:MAG: UbiA-like polyprenyltransferase [Gemmatimonadaceae bacterium]|nr:UbiA-like polyprenyltransferase [Gemmatimonadaceae bacterium]
MTRSDIGKTTTADAHFPLDGQVIAGSGRLTQYLNLVKFPHTLFALPFALVGVIGASRVAPITPTLVTLVVVAFTAARWAALSFNMLADRHWDAVNPRNAHRELPRGAISPRQALGSVLLSSGVFLVTAAMINPLTRALGPVALAWVLTYSLSKRFTHLTQVWLGVSLAIAPVGAWLAVTGAWSDPWWVLVAIAGGVTCWVAAFDLFHALPDLEFDIAHGLKSLVTMLGRPRAIIAARWLHAVAIPLFALYGIGAGLGPAFSAAVGVAAALLTAQHWMLATRGIAALPAVFYRLNAVLSAVMFAGALADRLAP